MQKETLALIACSLVLVRFSQAHNDFGHRISNINQTVQATGQSPGPGCESCVAAGAADGPGSQMQSCIDKICPDSTYAFVHQSQIADARAAGLDPNYQGQQVYESQIQPLVRQIVKDTAAESLARAQAMLDFAKRPPQRLRPADRRLFHLLRFYNLIEKFEVRSNPYGAPLLDRVASRRNLSDLSNSEFEAYAALADHYFAIESQVPFPVVDPIKLQAHDRQQIQAQIDRVIASILDTKEIVLNDPTFAAFRALPQFSTSLSRQELRRPFESGGLDAESLNGLNEVWSGLQLFSQIRANRQTQRAIDAAPIDLKKFIEQRHLVESLQQRINTLRPFVEGKQVAEAGHCRRAFAWAQTILPSQEQLSAGRDLARELQQTFADKTKHLICEREQGRYQDSILNLNPQFPQSPQQFTGSLRDALERARTEQAGWRERFDGLQSSPQRSSVLLMNLANYMPEISSPAAIINTTCFRMSPDVMPDSTSESGNRFVMGPIVLTDPRGRDISMHELGHKLYFFLKNSECEETQSWFRRVRHCLMENDRQLSQEMREYARMSVDAGFPTRHEVEDFADLLPGLFPELTSNACFMVRGREASNTWGVTQHDQTAEHSTPLFRLLHMNFLKTGQTPAICQEALEAQGEKVEFHDCLRNPPELRASSQTSPPARQ